MVSVLWDCCSQNQLLWAWKDAISLTGKSKILSSRRGKARDKLSKLSYISSTGWIGKYSPRF